MIIQDINYDSISDYEISNLIESTGFEGAFEEQSIDSHISQQYLIQEEDLL